ncbi:hypothetical protein [Streptomyces agglomeratus]|uniref:hypothetical protein n=1 Tax=Streptomyces agglomeratus TaxID=285458 RepID=UPI00114D149E|nr:hypothetical protein [Streptomyces agglomeratus]
MSEDSTDESPGLADAQDVLDRIEALAVRQRQQVEQSRTQMLAKLSRVQDDQSALLGRHSEMLTQQGEMLTEILTILRGTNPPAEATVPASPPPSTSDLRAAVRLARQRHQHGLNWALDVLHRTGAPTVWSWIGSVSTCRCGR